MTGRELWRCYKERHDNPLCIYFNPLRKLKVRLVIYGWILVQCCVVLYIANIAPDRFHGFITGKHLGTVRRTYTVCMYTLPVLLQLVLMTSWMSMRRRLVRSGRLRDIQTSGMLASRAEFGTLYPMVVLCAAIVVSFSVFGAILFSPLLHCHVPVDNIQSVSRSVEVVVNMLRRVVVQPLLICVIWAGAVLWDPAARIRSVAGAAVLSATGILSIESFEPWIGQGIYDSLSLLRSQLLPSEVWRIGIECIAFLLAVGMLMCALEALSHVRPRGLVGELDDPDRPLLAWHERESVFQGSRNPPRGAAGRARLGGISLNLLPFCFCVLTVVIFGIWLQAIQYANFAHRPEWLPTAHMPRPFSWQGYSVLKVVADYRLLELSQSLTHMAAVSLLPILHGVFLGLRKDVQSRLRELADCGRLLWVTSRAAFFPCLAIAAIPLGLGSFLLTQSTVPAGGGSVQMGWYPLIGAAQLLLVSFPVAVAALISVASARTPAFACMMWLCACAVLHMGWLVYTWAGDPFSWLFGSSYHYELSSIRHGSLFLALFSVFWVIPHSMRALDRERWARAEGGSAP